MPKKVGSLQLAITLIVLGAAIGLGKLTGSDWLGRVLDFWPLVLIAIGAEIVWRQSRAGSGEGPAWKLDGKSIFLLAFVLAAAGVFHAVNTAASAFSKDGIWGIFRNWGPTQTVTFRDEDLNLADADSLSIESSFGQIRVEGTGDNRVHLRAVAHVPAAARTAAEERAKQIQIQVSQGKKAKIVIDDQAVGQITGWQTPAVDLELQVPKKMLIDCKSNTGTIRVSGVAGVNVESDAGKVTVEKIAGPVKVKSDAGAIDVSEAGRVELESDMGSVTVRDIKENVQVRAHAGRVDVRTSVPVGGDWDLQTDMGSITLSYPAASSVTLEAKTDMGSISGPGFNQHGPNASVVRGDGKFRISAKTNAGAIHVTD
ncbi:DUF4097 family beta strand repeat-containing protein [Effusibacillus pohliae]|uniref:DUF4097 family beta strand repeat-containing protein n=1 Tax=Effusibacillus pohliae TaxID=232270 RepID=UPI000360CDD3|nr:DUF4097 family beta strand repeat-containing protein [Effusibacillus pohliae]